MNVTFGGSAARDIRAPEVQATASTTRSTRMPAEMTTLRIASMRRALRRAEAAVPGVRELDAELGGRLDVRFGQLAEQVETGLARDDARTAEDFLRRGEELVAETLAFVAGAAARHYCLDDGTAALAMRWLDRLSTAAGVEKVGVVIPASTEFTGMLTRVVRLRVPSD